MHGMKNLKEEIH